MCCISALANRRMIIEDDATAQRARARHTGDANEDSTHNAYTITACGLQSGNDRESLLYSHDSHMPLRVFVRISNGYLRKLLSRKHLDAGRPLCPRALARVRVIRKVRHSITRSSYRRARAIICTKSSWQSNLPAISTRLVLLAHLRTMRTAVIVCARHQKLFTRSLCAEPAEKDAEPSIIPGTTP